MAVKFYNTLSRKLEEFVPISGAESTVKGETDKPLVRMYTCGPTVHDFAHIGNFRTYVFEDILRRYLEYCGYEVRHVMNITDVEDKTIRKARTSGKPIKSITDPLIEAFFADLDKLNIERATVYPRATEHVDRMVDMIRQLMAKGIAYRSDDGSIYYDIHKFADYGKLAHVKLDELQPGARVAQDEYEKDTASDFALWKAWDESDGDVYWDQYEDLGKGRPGWHIECSAMSTQYLGNHFDIHTGGVDNIFPHHQNEVAQTEPCTGEKFVNYWMHSEHLQVEGKKMSKSLNNFFTLRDLLSADSNPSGKAWSAMAVRYQLLFTHYRSRLDFTFSGLQAAADTLEALSDFLRRCNQQEGAQPASPEIEKLVADALSGFVQAMDNDLNMPEALASLFIVRKEVNRIMAEQHDIGKAAGKLVLALFEKVDRVLGLRLLDALNTVSLSSEEMALIEERQAARKARDWKRADEVRAQLLERGIILEDTPKGLTWKINQNKR